MVSQSSLSFASSQIWNRGKSSRFAGIFAVFILASMLAGNATAGWPFHRHHRGFFGHHYRVYPTRITYFAPRVFHPRRFVTSYYATNYYATSYFSNVHYGCLGPQYVAPVYYAPQPVYRYRIHYSPAVVGVPLCSADTPTPPHAPSTYASSLVGRIASSNVSSPNAAASQMLAVGHSESNLNTPSQLANNWKNTLQSREHQAVRNQSANVIEQEVALPGRFASFANATKLQIPSSTAAIASDLIDDMFQAGAFREAVSACRQLASAYEGIPSNIYLRHALAASMIDDHSLECVAAIGLAIANGSEVRTPEIDLQDSQGLFDASIQRHAKTALEMDEPESLIVLAFLLRMDGQSERAAFLVDEAVRQSDGDLHTIATAIQSLAR